MYVTRVSLYSFFSYLRFPTCFLFILPYIHSLSYSGLTVSHVCFPRHYLCICYAMHVSLFTCYLCRLLYLLPRLVLFIFSCLCYKSCVRPQLLPLSSFHYSLLVRLWICYTKLLLGASRTNGVPRHFSEMYGAGLAAGTDGRKGVVAGWGLTAEDGRPSNKLMEASNRSLCTELREMLRYVFSCA